MPHRAAAKRQRAARAFRRTPLTCRHAPPVSMYTWVPARACMGVGGARGDRQHAQLRQDALGEA